MTFADIAEALVREGWTLDDNRVVTPCGNWWASRGEVERGLRDIYEHAAHIAHRFPEWPIAPELQRFMRVLERDPEIATLARHMIALHGAVADFAAEHGMTITLWRFDRASVRASARHPSYGSAVIECLIAVPPTVDVYAYHWVDDYSRNVRLSRRSTFPGTNLAERLAAALEFLRLSPDRASLDDSSYWKHDEETIARERAYWEAHAVLR